MKNIQRVSGTLLGAVLLVFSGSALADWQLNLTEGVTEISREVYGMHMMVLWICVAIGVVVFGAMFYSILKHRKSQGATPATFHESVVAEVSWTVVPFVVLIAMALPAAKALIKMEDTSNSDLTVKVTGHQWKWEYEYVDSGVRFFSSLDTASREASARDSGIDVHSVDNYLLDVDNRLVLPVGKKIRFLLTSNDVLHAWWVPAFAIKKDAIPGYINGMWTNIDEEGVYRGQCAELCGKDHGYMPIVVEAVSQDRYDEWVGEQLAAAEAEANSADKEWTMDDLMAKGEAVYGTSCAACHQGNGQGIPGVFPALAGSPMALGDIKTHIDIVINGKAGSAMQAFGAQLSDVDIAAIVTYERNAWGNDTGDVVQPSAIKAQR
ncbi:MAG: cytochrome c oxidase subunit II [Gammaproteobacteria bacterium]|nr:cytochrome c oxidase subunit II [Gammaproteobacteria bacterium]